MKLFGNKLAFSLDDRTILQKPLQQIEAKAVDGCVAVRLSACSIDVMLQCKKQQQDVEHTHTPSFFANAMRRNEIIMT